MVVILLNSNLQSLKIQSQIIKLEHVSFKFSDFFVCFGVMELKVKEEEQIYYALMVQLFIVLFILLIFNSLKFLKVIFKLMWHNQLFIRILFFDILLLYVLWWYLFKWVNFLCHLHIKKILNFLKKKDITIVVKQFLKFTSITCTFFKALKKEYSVFSVILLQCFFIFINNILLHHKEYSYLCFCEM